MKDAERNYGGCGRTSTYSGSGDEVGVLIAEYYCAPIEHAVRTVLPSAVRRQGAQHKKQLEVSLLDPDGVGSSALQKKVVERLRKQGPILLRHIKAELGCSSHRFVR